MTPRYFTLEQARASLPAARAIVERLRPDRLRLIELRGEIGRAVRKTRGNGHLDWQREQAQQPELEQIGERLNAGLRELEELGILVKDLDAGLLDWPSLRDGREVYLCWRDGEPDILYWHPVDEGFAGRRPL